MASSACSKKLEGSSSSEMVLFVSLVVFGVPCDRAKILNSVERKFTHS